MLGMLVVLLIAAHREELAAFPGGMLGHGLDVGRGRGRRRGVDALGAVALEKLGQLVRGGCGRRGWRWVVLGRHWPMMMVDGTGGAGYIWSSLDGVSAGRGAAGPAETHQRERDKNAANECAKCVRGWNRGAAGTRRDRARGGPAAAVESLLISGSERVSCRARGRRWW